MRAVAAGVTDVGLQRDHNEDSFAILEDHTLYIVADGMGGHRAGDVASKLATEAIAGRFSRYGDRRLHLAIPLRFPSFRRGKPIADRDSHRPNRQIVWIVLARRSREYHGMGTTVVGCLFSPAQEEKCTSVTSASSRAYRVREARSSR